MASQVLQAEKEIVKVLRKATEPLTVAEVVEKVRQNAHLMERDIRPGFWALVASGKVLVDSSLRGILDKQE